jgi:hypothetical protein
MAAEHALAALRALHTSSDAQQRQAANAWLIDFTSSPEAFLAARELLLSGDEQAAFFGACTLHTKIAAEWHGMAEPERAAVRDEMWRLLDSPGLRTIVVSRLALAVAAVAGRSADEASFLCQAVGMLRAPASQLVGLRLLQAAADEFDPDASRRLSRDRDAGATSLASAWPEVWQGLADALNGMRQEMPATPELEDPVCLCFSSARALLRWAPLPAVVITGGGVGAAVSGPGGAAMSPGATELASLLAAVSEWIAPGDDADTRGGATPAAGLNTGGGIRRAGEAAECLAEVMGRRNSGAALRLAMPTLLPALGGALRRLPAVVTSASGSAGEEYGCRLCFCLCELARGWLVTLAADAAPSLVDAVGDLLRDGALPDGLFWRCVEVCEAVVESQLGREEGGESGLSGASGGASALLEQRTIEATMGCVPPVLDRLAAAAGAHGGAAVCTGDWIGGAEAASEAAHMQGAEDGEEMEEDLMHAGALCNSLLLALAAERPSSVLSGLTDAIEPALAAMASPVGQEGDNAAAARVGTLAALLGAVVPAAAEARAPLSRLLHGLESALPRIVPAARAGRPGQRAHLSLLRLLLCCCVTACTGAVEPESEESSQAVGFLLSLLMDVLWRQAESPSGAVPAATSLLVRAVSRRWPTAVHSTQGMARVRAELLSLAPRFAPADQPPLVAAAACAFLIPPGGASPPASPEGGQLLDSLCASWVDLSPGASDAQVAAALEAAEPPARCLALLAELLVSSHLTEREKYQKRNSLAARACVRQSLPRVAWLFSQSYW